MKAHSWIASGVAALLFAGIAMSHREDEHHVDIRSGRIRHTITRAYVFTNRIIENTWLSDIVDPEGRVNPDWRFMGGGTDGFLGGLRRDGVWGPPFSAARNLHLTHEMGCVTDRALEACCRALVDGWSSAVPPDESALLDLSTFLMGFKDQAPATLVDVEPFLARLRGEE